MIDSIQLRVPTPLPKVASRPLAPRWRPLALGRTEGALSAYAERD